jgi:hypothetical protein
MLALQDFLTRVVRTGISYAIAWLLGLQFAQPLLDAFNITGEQVSQYAVALGVFIFGTLYYMFATLVEKKFGTRYPIVLWLLGVPKKPVYVNPDGTATGPKPVNPHPATIDGEDESYDPLADDLSDDDGSAA